MKIETKYAVHLKKLGEFEKVHNEEGNLFKIGDDLFIPTSSFEIGLVSYSPDILAGALLSILLKHNSGDDYKTLVQELKSIINYQLGFDENSQFLDGWIDGN